MRVTATVHHVRLRPLRPSSEPSTRPLVLVRLEDDDGLVGHGEAAPLVEYDGVSVEMVIDALDTGAPLPQALAAIDMARWDLDGKRAGKPVCELLGGPSGSAPVAVNATIGAVEPAAAGAEARAALDAGFGCIKVKVGTPDDRQRLAAVREAVGREMLIRVDANGAWDQLTAPERIRALARFDIELFEEPVHGLPAMRAVARAVPDTALATDESAAELLGSDAERVGDAVCLKISSSGGITGLLADAERARALGYEVYIASTLDGPLGIGAALHAAAVVHPDRHCGLATLGRFDRAIPGQLAPAGGHMRVPGGSGLGDGLLDWYGAPL